MINFLLIVAANAQSEDECFENARRGLSKFNQGFDNFVLEPVS